ncbi:MBL fold metallo-hydrolase [Rugamonas rubra]|uniref:Metallo-beta-lactamase superfamily protein n=1 Tax=Rugamonas rubra TaxID=758825 RepID=A0A1I4RJW3_9BURK|nr:MBL fold metallo-hydrolase [Rugamonas rubra]SFM52210.1 Metallo-beta-lactamase superfamily protein [Rugamonas rubra]
MIQKHTKSVRAALLLGAFAAVGAAPAFAAAPLAKFQAPGFYRVMLGDFEVTALSDGTVELPVNTVLKSSPAKVDRALAKSFLKSPLETSFNAFLVNTGGKLVLIDTGAAGLFGPTLGKLAANLKAAGYQPEQVDEVYITHLHPDHVGGLAAGDQVAFPNAIVRADQRDADFWLNPAEMDKAPAEVKGFFQGAMKSMAPYVKAGKFQAFSGNTDLVPGVKAYASNGHTPGHTTYVVESRGQKLVLLGDLLHVQAVQFDQPEVAISFDNDSKHAVSERKAAFAAAAKQGYMIGAAHLSFPGLGHVRANGKGYQFVPLNYSVPK